MKSQMVHAGNKPRSNVLIVALVALVIVLMAGWVITAQANSLTPSSENFAMGEVEAKTYQSDISGLKTEVAGLSVGQSRLQNELTVLKTELAETKAQLDQLKSAAGITYQPQITALIEKQSQLAEQITALETGVQSHVNYGINTRLGNQVDEIVEILGWTAEMVPCNSFGPYQETILSTGKAFLAYEGSDWNHSQCFVNFSGWDEKDMESGYFLGVFFEARYSGSCSWEPNSYYIASTEQTEIPFAGGKFTNDLLGTTDADKLTERIFGKGLTTYIFQDHGHNCSEPPNVLTTRQGVYRLYPISMEELLMLWDRNVIHYAEYGNR